MATNAQKIAQHLDDMFAAEREAEARFVITSRKAPLACRHCQIPNGPPHAIEADYPEWVCPTCRADRDGLLDV